MIIVTGGLGFIGYNIIKELNKRGITDIVIVENLRKTKSLDIKLKRLLDIRFIDLVDREDFDIEKFKKVEVIFHQGACTNTQESNFNYLFENNYLWTKKIMDYCLKNGVKMIYASSASVYGNNGLSNEESKLNPLNYYAYSKYLVDNYFLSFKVENRIVGLRYFNVYGPYEENKGSMSSVIFQFYNQLKKDGKLYLFEGSEFFKRDFIFVEDIVRINMFFFENNYSGIYNCGTGESRSFLEVAKEVIKNLGFGQIQFIPFPSQLKGKYQELTLADNSKLRKIFKLTFTPLEEGVKRYISYLKNNTIEDE